MKFKDLKIGKQCRGLDDPSKREILVDKESRTIQFPFSSEYPVERFWGKEILSHEKSAADFSRLNDSAPLLFNHDPDVVIGVVEKAWIGDDKRAHAKVRFGNSPKAQEILKDVEDQIIRNVSFGYQIKEMQLKKESDEGNEYLVTKFMPYEISLVSIPADQSVGLGRSDEGDETKVQITKEVDETKKGEKKMTIDVIPPQLDEKKIKDAERSRVQEITALGEKFKDQDLARQLIEGDKSVLEAYRAFNSKKPEQAPVIKAAETIGLTDKEVRKFSLMKMIRHKSDPTNQNYAEAAKFEIESCREAAKKVGKEARGFILPMDVLQQFTRDITVANTGSAVETSVKFDSFIEPLRKSILLDKLGATILTGLQGDTKLPRGTTLASAYWVAEGGSPTESTPAMDQVSLSPKTCAGFVDITRKFILQTSVDAEEWVKNELRNALKREIDRSAFYGSGSSNQPIGLANVTDLPEVDFAGATPTFAKLVEMETTIASADAEAANMAYAMNAAGRGHAKTLEKASNTAQFVWEQGNTVNGYRVEVSNQISAGDYFFGNWKDFVVGLWSELDVFVDPYTFSSSQTLRIIAFQDVDFAVRHKESFVRGYDVTP